MFVKKKLPNYFLCFNLNIKISRKKSYLTRLQRNRNLRCTNPGGHQIVNKFKLPSCTLLFRFSFDNDNFKENSYSSWFVRYGLNPRIELFVSARICALPKNDHVSRTVRDSNFSLKFSFNLWKTNRESATFFHEKLILKN